MKARRNILIGLLMTSLSAWGISRGLAFSWVGTIFFGGGTIFFIVKFFRSTIRGVEISDQNITGYKDQNEKNFKEIYTDNGIFTFSDLGFSIKTKEGVQSIKWTEIISMHGYKEDHYVTDNICLDVFCDNNQSFKITEETRGWFRFLDHSKKALPSIDKSSELKISTPDFEKKMTVVYNRPDGQM
jgi:hypothetical protein